MGWRRFGSTFLGAVHLLNPDCTDLILWDFGNRIKLGVGQNISSAFEEVERHEYCFSPSYIGQLHTR